MIPTDVNTHTGIICIDEYYLCKWIAALRAAYITNEKAMGRFDVPSSPLPFSSACCVAVAPGSPARASSSGP